MPDPARPEPHRTRRPPRRRSLLGSGVQSLLAFGAGVAIVVIAVLIWSLLEAGSGSGVTLDDSTGDGQRDLSGPARAAQNAARAVEGLLGGG